MKEETTSSNTSDTSDNSVGNETNNPNSFLEVMSVLGAFGELIDKVVKHAEPAKNKPEKDTVTHPDGKETNAARLAIFMLLERNKETALQQFPEIKHLDIEPENGYIFAVINDEHFDNIPVARLKSIKNYFYQSADDGKKADINTHNFKMVFDSHSNFNKHENAYIYFLSDDVANQVTV
jgi:hypothetical protein